MSHTAREIIDRMIDYLENVIEKPHPAFGDMPICPFSRKARIANKIQYQVCPFSTSELHPESNFMQGILAFAQQEFCEILLVIHPDPTALTLAETHDFVDVANLQLADLGLLLFDGHPEDPFNIQGVYTRCAPYIHLTVQQQHRVKQASDLLLKTTYYDHWTPENLNYVGMPR